MKSKKTPIIVRTQIQNLVFVISLQIVHRNTHLREYKKFHDGAHLQTTACITAHISDGVGCDGDGV